LLTILNQYKKYNTYSLKEREHLSMDIKIYTITKSEGKEEDDEKVSFNQKFISIN